MPGYLTQQQAVFIGGVDPLQIRSLLDRQQFFDRSGEAARLGISSAMWPLFGMLWPSGAHLAQRLALRPVQASERILEIGCGLALASLVGHRRGADVTASDCHPLAESFLRENLRLNQLLPMKYSHGQWGAASVDVQASSKPCIRGRYELIIGSDLLYERDANGDLASYIGEHATATGEVWIVDPDRGNRPAFHRQMAAQGFAMQEELLRLPRAGNVAAYKGRVLIYRRNMQAQCCEPGGS